MRKRQRLAFFAIAGLGLLAAIAPGLAAGIAVPSTTPAAGQGAVLVEGFTVTDIDWAINDDGYVTSVTFDIARDTAVTARQPVVAAADELSGDAVVRARLEVGSGSPFVSTKTSQWNSCVVTVAGANAFGDATCTFPGAAGTAPAIGITASELSRVNIIAFDR